MSDIELVKSCLRVIPDFPIKVNNLYINMTKK